MEGRADLDDDGHDGVDDAHGGGNYGGGDHGGRLGYPRDGLQLPRQPAREVVGLGRKHDDRCPRSHLSRITSRYIYHHVGNRKDRKRGSCRVSCACIYVARQLNACSILHDVAPLIQTFQGVGEVSI